MIRITRPLKEARPVWPAVRTASAAISAISCWRRFSNGSSLMKSIILPPPGSARRPTAGPYRAVIAQTGGGSTGTHLEAVECPVLPERDPVAIQNETNNMALFCDFENVAIG